MPEGRSQAIAIVTSFFLGLSLITVLLRCHVRLHIVQAFGWDDYVMVAATVLNVGFAVCGIAGAHYGIGQRMSYFQTQPDNFRIAMLYWWLGQNFYVVTCMVAKISIVISLLRIFVRRIHIAILYAVIAVTVVVACIFFFFTIFQCDPVQYFWMRMTTHGKCIDTDILINIAYLYSVTAAITDLTIGLLPTVLIWNLQMNTRAKLALAGILGLGCIASAAVIIRIPYIHHYEDPDFLYASADISIWSNVEAGLGITAGSLTTLRPLLRVLRESSAGTRGRTGGAGSIPLSSTRNGGKKSQTTSHLSQGGHGHHSSRQLWSAGSEPEAYAGVTTTIMSKDRNSSEESLTRPHLQGLKVERTFRVSVTD